MSAQYRGRLLHRLRVLAAGVVVAAGLLALVAGTEEGTANVDASASLQDRSPRDYAPDRSGLYAGPNDERPHAVEYTVGDEAGDRVPVALMAHAQPAADLVANTSQVEVGGAVNWSELVTQGNIGAGAVEAGDGVGAAILVHDMNRDGIDDLVFGAPFEDIGAVADAGAITLIPGEVRSFQSEPVFWDSQPVETYSQDGEIPGALEAGDNFGASLAAGDFNGDGLPDLAVGAPGEALGSRDNAGSVTILRATSAGIRDDLGFFIHQDSFGVTGNGEPDDRFGESVAVADFNGDGRDDLAVGVPGEDIGNIVDAGAFHIFFGSASFIVSTSGGQFFSAAEPNVEGAPEAGDRVGESLAAGDFNRDGFADLAVGIPGEDIGNIVDAGAVQIFYGSASGLRTDNDVLLHQDSPGIGGVAEAQDEFGAALATGDFRNLGDYPTDLAIGAPGEDVGSLTDAGAVHVLYGDTSGIRTDNDLLLHQDSPGIEGIAEAFDRFGEAVATGPALTNAVTSGFDDLVVGAPGEDIGTTVNAGAIHVIRGGAAGVTTADDTLVWSDLAGVFGASEPQDRFGAVVAVGDVSGSFQPAVVTGSPGEDVGAVPDAGAVVAFDPRPPAPAIATDRTDDISGRQVHVMHVLPSDAVEGRNMDSGIRVDTVVVGDWFRDELDNRDIRFDTFQGSLDLTTLRLGVPAAAIGPAANDIDNLRNQIRAAGFNDPNKIYLVYYEGPGNACGVTYSFSIAIIWMQSCGGAWPQFLQFPSASTYLYVHELAHGLGAVPSCAPNYEGTGHVDDNAMDPLYVSNAGPPDFQNLALDPGNDDYYKHNNGSCPDLDDSPYIE